MTAPPVPPMLLLALAGPWEITLRCQQRRIPVGGGEGGCKMGLAGWGVCVGNTPGCWGGGDRPPSGGLRIASPAAWLSSLH